ncbi:hypothetical protein BDK51DRAFT_26428 [Blyttiomyces helicus]|uniref:CBM1 domain-containing protein n=1 Tax=Blyttiomyces helicus TaxID=388810 RepID=A0A4P9VZ48_9FUNG|nr:hypothetical protein BDK51DRAFT_26428 [Blyttiomyces helicus]|eukprot:RKO85079.1 hypothetical protein BDK51DRAFT_26428 [Blyttiomyces helicus]
MLSKTILASATLAVAAVAAPSYSYDQPSYVSKPSGYGGSFPNCVNYVEKPAWGGDGKPYGYENGQSCIAITYGSSGDSYSSYGKPTYNSYEKPTYNSYQTPTYNSYQTPTYNTYETPSYKTYAHKSYLAPASNSYQYKKVDTHEQPSSNTYEKPSYNTYQQPSYNTHQQPSYNTYEKPSYNTYEKPSYDSYSKPTYSTYGTPSYTPSNTCEAAKPYFESTRSATLIQCASIACAPDQTTEYVQRALYQCYALESQAKLTNGGSLPEGW